MELTTLFFLISLAIIAFCYSAVGHGGASGYIAVFALFGMVTPSMKFFVLVMNLVVASIAFYQYYSKGHFKLKYFLPFGLGAAPMAYLGASLELDTALYHYILAGFLLFSVVYLLGFLNRFKLSFQVNYSPVIAVVIAMLLGFVSGVAGVGGGIFLSPILLIFAWLKLKETAAVSALFIVVNSLAGLLAIQHVQMLITTDLMLKLIFISGFGFFGSRWGVSLEKTYILMYMLAFVLFIAAIKLCLT